VAMSTTQSYSDPFAEWLLVRRYGNDLDEFVKIESSPNQVREQVLANAFIAPGDTVLDIGTGTGILAFGALERVGKQGIVIFNDTSKALLDYCRQKATQEQVIDRCRCIQASATNLTEIESDSIDAVVIRAVLIFVTDRGHVFKPGGRLSLFEPVSRLGFMEERQPFGEYEVGYVSHLVSKVRAAYDQLSNPLVQVLEIDERELISHALAVGFEEIYADLHVSISQARPISWDTYIRRAQNPKVPSILEAMQVALTESEIQQLTAHFLPLVESGQGKIRGGGIYLTAIK